MRPNPQQKLPESAIKAWRVSGLINSLFFWAIPAVLWFIYLDSGSPPVWVIVATALAALFLSIIIVFITPLVRYRHWRYEIDENEVDLKYGIIVIRRTLVPIKRVQHVDTQQGPILRNYGLSTVTISTAATTHQIPALDEETADTVRQQISQFARLAKEDV